MFICKERPRFRFVFFSESSCSQQYRYYKTKQWNYWRPVRLWQIGTTVWWNVTADKGLQMLLTKSSLQLTFILNVSEFHLVLKATPVGSTRHGSLSSFIRCPLMAKLRWPVAVQARGTSRVPDAVERSCCWRPCTEWAGTHRWAR